MRAYIRRCNGEGAPAAVLRRGAEEAGAIFIKINLLDGTALLFGPAPAGMYAEDRLWVALMEGAAALEREADDYLGRQTRYDEDLWIVEVEDRQGRHFLGDWLSIR